ncbi:lipopolysaccharide transport periplasmic protein LptA [Rhodobacteraceae bacterium 2CG4]|uniref:Lipopolysaccharide transport periplasmic protein LptA n=1 Tax=Halovulum marinum TaxID=2662447 RepID=A0A6L5Z682_9RHOB|nr:lipopolysaccharide transport periplasmic protein LptA [Halovulum marinum]MSU91554.1 lipopolysaccharide transport periplasmic protein LptA [Halovulum marinum]
MNTRFLPLAVAAWIGSAAVAGAQATVPFGGFAHDSSQQVEISAESLTVDQSAGSVVFEGEVLVGQGTMRMSADRITVFYSGSGRSGDVTRMEAEGSVTLTNGAEAAEAQAAAYDVAGALITMTGDVLLTQGENALSGQELEIDLDTGTARMKGRVQTILQPETRQ